MKKLAFLFCLFLSIVPLIAEDISVEAYVDKKKVGVQDFLKLTLNISGEKADNIPAPNLPDIKNFSNRGVSTSSSTSMSIINGKMTSKTSKEFIYTLQPQKMGNYLIPPVNIQIDGKNYTTDPIQINVIAGSANPPPRTSNRSKNPKNNNSNISDNLFLKTDISKRDIYVNEPTIVKYKLYTRYNIANLSFGSDPNFEGFWKEDIYVPKAVDFTTETIDGIRYNTMLMRSVALFPTESGLLELPELELIVDIRQQARSFFDFGSTKRYTVKSKKKNIQVRSIPEKNKPPTFRNAVGSYKLSSKINKEKLKVGDSFTYTLKISGKGNLKQFNISSLPEIRNLRFLDPEISTHINNDKISGYKTIKYLVIVQEKGKFTIPSLEFSYFDTDLKKFITKKTLAFTIEVTEGDKTLIHSSSAQSLVQKEGSDIGFIITNSDLNDHNLYFNSFMYWLLWVISIIFIPASIIFSQEKLKLMENENYLRQKRAKKILKKYMKKASTEAEKQNMEFYSAAQIGLSNYLADKLKIPRGSSTEKLLTQLKTHKIQDPILENIEEMFQICDQARFMPGGFSKNNISENYKMLQDIVNDISKIKFI